MVADLIRHFRVIRRLWLISVQKDLTFRWQFAADLLDECASVALSLLLFDIAFAHAPTIAGWSQDQAVLLVGVFQIYSVLIMAFLMPNLEAISRTVFQGQLDSLLLRPVSVQLMLSLRSVRVTSLLRLIPGLAIVVWALDSLGSVPSPLDFVVAGGLLLSGLVIVYAIWFATLTVEFWCEGLWSMELLVPALFEYGRFPDGVFLGLAKTVFLTVLPVIVVANYPLHALLGDWSIGMVLYALCLAVIFMIISRMQWRLGLRRYSSASS